MSFKHISVLLDECIEGLNIKPNGVYVDGTLGGAGHSLEICKHLDVNGVLIGIDQDTAALETAAMRLEDQICNVKLVHSNYEHFKQIIDNLSIEKVDGILLDLGVSSYQLDTAERGFSYMKDAPLDMRMDQTSTKTARDIVNYYSEQELVRILKVYGEEKFANRIAKKIIEQREKKEIETTLELVSIIDTCIPTKNKIKFGHPAKRSFQAIRIELNRELEVLQDTLVTMVDSLKPEGRFCVITFHSLEDRIVKHVFRDLENPCTCPSDFPMCVCGLKSKGKMKPRRAILPTNEELEMNSRSKSAKLRIFEKVGDFDE
jgi:16S rRNA (cytosine1402-N4)-methyltransferase